MSQPFTIDDDGPILTVRITPKASRDAVGAVIEQPDGRPALAVRIAAPPVDGAANAALIAFLAKALGVARGKVGILSGETGRLKRLRIMGDTEAIAARLAGLIER